MRHRTERANKPRALRVLNRIHNHGPSRTAQAEQNLRRRREPRRNLYHRLRGRFYCRLTRRLPYPAHCSLPRRRPPRRAPCTASRRSAGCHIQLSVSLPRLVRSHFNPIAAAALTASRKLMACGAARSSGRSCASCASLHPASENPKAFAGDCPSRGLHHRRADGPPGSWPRREP
jgi:hypothetical protein